MVTRKQKEDVARRVHKRLCDTNNPSFATIAHNCGVTIAEVNMLKKHGFVVSKEDGWIWNGECNPKKVIDSIVISERGYKEYTNTLDQNVNRMIISGIKVNTYFNNIEVLEVGHAH